MLAPLKKLLSLSLIFSLSVLPTAVAQVRFVKDSGICETTPGVHQISGYVDVGTNMSMFFWFFEARSSADTAPLTTWIAGGPGCSALGGLFGGIGPCNVNPDENETSLNPFSWTAFTNIIFIDYPVGSGFSYGTETVNTTQAASPYLWTFFQNLFNTPEFATYKNREFILGTSSYGGHWGPSIVKHFNEQNRLIRLGQLVGQEIITTALVINNGWVDPYIQGKSYLDFARNAPGYGQLQSDAVIANMTRDFYRPNGCGDLIHECNRGGRSPAYNSVCREAIIFCTERIIAPAQTGRNFNDLRETAPMPMPAFNPVTFLSDPIVRQRIGAEVPVVPCSQLTFDLFRATGDNCRTWLPELGELADTGLRIAIAAGDADINCNWLGVHASMLAMDWAGKRELSDTPLTNISMEIGGTRKTVAAVQNVRNFSFARVYGASHSIVATQPQVAMELVLQVVLKQPFHSI